MTLWRITPLLAALALLGCSHAQVQTSEAYYGPPVPRPNHVYVTWFAVSPDQVRLDQGVAARVDRMTGGQSVSADERDAAQQTRAALAEDLVDRLRQYGLPAVVATAPPTGSNDVLIQGQIVSIDEGNRTRRLVIGFGAGRSSVGADAQMFHLTATAPPRFMIAFQGRADSGRMPGAVETMGAGAAAQRIGESGAVAGATHAGAETRRTSDTAEARALADQLALSIGRFAEAQGWIAAGAVP